MPRSNTRRTVARTVAAALAVTMVSTVLPSAVRAAPSPVSVPANATSGLVQGAVGPGVTEVQQALINRGAYLPGGPDGVFGVATAKAIGDVQQWNGLTRTGSLNPATLRLLGLTSGASSLSSSASSSTYGSLRVGSTGPAVAELQRALLATGLVISGGADGAYGPATQRAVKAFQRVNGMTETGNMSDRAANLLRLGSGAQSASGSGTSSGSSSGGGGWVNLERFPVQGHCAFGDTWHAPRGNGRRHEGVDIIAATGNLLYAVADATVTTVYWDYPGRLSGNGLKLTAPDGTYYLYLHMSGFAPGVQRGTKVTAGDVIGFVGNTGSSATPHLHFEIHPGGGGAVNPYPYVKAIDDCSNTRARYQSSFS